VSPTGSPGPPVERNGRCGSCLYPATALCSALVRAAEMPPAISLTPSSRLTGRCRQTRQGLARECLFKFTADATRTPLVMTYAFINWLLDRRRWGGRFRSKTGRIGEACEARGSATGGRRGGLQIGIYRQMTHRDSGPCFHCPLGPTCSHVPAAPLAPERASKRRSDWPVDCSPRGRVNTPWPGTDQRAVSRIAG
jgi:hypothetical protein